MEIIGGIILIVYLVAGYWATGKTIYANKIVICAPGQLFIRKLAIGLIFGMFLIPIALIRKIFGI